MSPPLVTRPCTNSDGPGGGGPRSSLNGVSLGGGCRDRASSFRRDTHWRRQFGRPEQQVYRRIKRTRGNLSVHETLLRFTCWVRTFRLPPPTPHCVLQNIVRGPAVVRVLFRVKRLHCSRPLLKICKSYRVIVPREKNVRLVCSSAASRRRSVLIHVLAAREFSIVTVRLFFGCVFSANAARRAEALTVTD